MANNTSPLVGLSNLCYAKLTDETTNSYGSVANIAPAINAKISPKSASATLYADNGAIETATSMGEVEIELEMSAIPQEIIADLLGHTIDNTTGVITYASTDTAPYVALGFKAKKANGHYRWIWLLKGKFQEVEEEYKTSSDKVEYNTSKIKAVFVTRTDGNWKYSSDDDAGTTPPTTFLDTVYAPTVSTSAPTVTCVPTDAATGVVVSTSPALTFSVAVDPTTITSANVFLMKSDGTAVAATLTLGTNNTVVTIDPTSNMSGSTAHVIVVTTNVKSTYGVPLAANNIFNFTTA